MDFKKTFSRFKKPGGIAMGLCLFLFFLLFNPFRLLSNANVVLSVTILMVCWWIIEIIPLAVTALLPLVLFPLLNVFSIKEVAKSYADPIVFLFMGGFFIAIAIEKWNLHKRIALNIINITGVNGNRIIVGFILATGFLSLWLSNSATTMMMFPIAMSVIKIMERNKINEKDLNNFSLSLMLSIAYASNFAVGTIIGTAPNIAYVNYISESMHYQISFSNWMVLFIPLTIFLLLLLYLIVVKILYPNNIGETEHGKNYINKELKNLGGLSLQEKRVAFVFIITVGGWIFKDVINNLQHAIKLDDTIIGLSGAFLLFIIPAGLNREGRESLLTWNDGNKMAWNILILLGGGMALAKAVEDVKLINLLDSYFAVFEGANTFLIVLIVTGFSVFLSELISNIAQVMVMVPFISSFASAIHIDPLLLGIPMTLGASCASMLPMGTPPNAIVYASGHVKLKQMLKAGFVLNIVCTFVISTFCYFLQPLILKLT